MVWNWDWASVDDSAIVPEAIPKKNAAGPAAGTPRDGTALIGG